jgi:hypothetical protein
MTPFRLSLTAALLLALAGPLAAKETAGFIVRLGTDTTAVERYLGTDSHLEVDQVARAPRVLLRHYAYDFGPDGAMTKFSIVVTAPGAAADAPPLQRIDGTCTRDSVIAESHRGAAVQMFRAAVPAGSVIVYSQSPWVMYERALARLAKGKPDTLRAGMYFIGSDHNGWIRLQRLGRDSVLVATEHEDVFKMRADRAGKLLGALPIAGTGKFTVSREATVDLDAYSAAWSAAEKASGAMGQLSTRDTVSVNAGGASLWIDYGRPSKRGRVVYGGVVPFGEVWRTGANAATQFKTDRALDFGGHALPAGFYTLWTIPSATGWKLVINSETGQWGTEHKADKDLLTLDMALSALGAAVERFTIGVEPGAQGGVLHMDWDTTRASIAFTAAAN